MQQQPTNVSSSWCGNLHYVHEVATQGVHWLFGCLPCVKGHHRVHPTSFDAPDAVFIVLDAKKRLRVLHVIPNVSNLNLSVKAEVTDQLDSGDRCSLYSSGEDYWFMRWNRPIRPNLQRNSCNCSFRRSQIKLTVDNKDSKPVEFNNGGPIRPASEKKSAPPETLPESLSEDSLQNLAEKLSHVIVSEAVQKSMEIKTGVNDQHHECSNVSEVVGDITLKCCDNVSVEEIKLTIRNSHSEFGGYLNPVFIASNDALDLIPSNETQNNSCDTQCEKSNKNVVTADEDGFMNELQDYNANDQSHVLGGVHIHYKENVGSLKKNAATRKDDNADKKKHRKSCLSGAKAYLKKPVVLLIHGAGSSCEVWRNLISHLERGGYECVAPDLLGHGLSSAPDNSNFYTFHAFLQDLLGIFDRFVTEGRTAVVLGHGYGCSLAAAIARYRPEQVIQLVLISGGGPTPLAPRTPPSVSPCLKACLEPLLMCGFKRDVVYSVCGKQMVPISPEESAVPRHIVEHIAQGHVWPEGDAAFHRRIVVPTLLVHGMKDQHITLVQQCEMERTIPRSFLEVIPEAGHWAMLDTPSQLSHMILCFIDWWAPPNRTQ